GVEVHLVNSALNLILAILVPVVRRPYGGIEHFVVAVLERWCPRSDAIRHLGLVFREQACGECHLLDCVSKPAWRNCRSEQRAAHRVGVGQVGRVVIDQWLTPHATAKSGDQSLLPVNHITSVIQLSQSNVATNLVVVIDGAYRDRRSSSGQWRSQLLSVLPHRHPPRLVLFGPEECTEP